MPTAIITISEVVFTASAKFFWQIFIFSKILRELLMKNKGKVIIIIIIWIGVHL